MSAPKFTPGPWRTNLCVTSPAGRVAIEPDIAVVYVQATRYGDAQSKTRLANARLIAAAPDLHAACHALIYGDDLQVAIDLARAALAKARWEAQP